MSTTLSVGADITPRIDTMIGKLACLSWHKLFTQEMKRTESWTGDLVTAWGESFWECGLIHLKLRSWADSDLSECLCGWHFPSLAGVLGGTQSPPGNGASQGREQCTKACGALRRQGLDNPCFQGTPLLGDKTAVANISGRHTCRANSGRWRKRWNMLSVNTKKRKCNLNDQSFPCP